MAQRLDDQNHAKRLATFGISATDIALLRQQASFAKTRLPGLLEKLHSSFDSWPEIQAALKKPDVHAIRLDHWSRAVTGQIEEGFLDSAKALASIFYANQVPGYAVAICHFSVLTGIIRELGLDQDGGGNPLKRLLGRGRQSKMAALRRVATKIAWLDLELLLETYAQAEHDTRAAALREMAETIEREASTAVDQVNKLTRELAETAKTMSATAAETGQSAGQAANAANRALDTTQAVAGSAEQLACAVDEITQQMSKSRQVAEAAVTTSRQAQVSIDALSRQATDISQIAALITNIASRTNLLALNATIEAARAGEAGKGFAVVASEVKQLASQTAQATQQITQQINAVQQATTNAAEAMASIAVKIGEIDHIGTSIAAAVEQQSASTAEIARSMGEAAETARVMVTENTHVQTAAQQTDEQAGVVETTSGVLQDAVRNLRQAVIRVVRTSTREVDRRGIDRVQVDLSGHLVLGGHESRAVHIDDLSLKGAMLRTDCRAPVGTRGTLKFDGMTVALVVRNLYEKGLGVAFAADEAQNARLNALLQRNNQIAA